MPDTLTGMPDTSDDLATRLLDAQVAFTLRQLTETAEFSALVDDEIAFFFSESGTIPLETAMPRDLVKAVARKYTMQFPVEGAIPELVGQVAGRLYRSDAHENTRAAEVIETRRFDELAGAAVEIPVAQRAVAQVLESPATADTIVEVVQRAVEQKIGQRMTRRFSGLIERWTRRGTDFVLESAREDSDELLLDAVREFWRGHSGESLVGFRETVGESDVEDIVVLAFEFWRTFRQTEYLRTLLDTGIDEVFDTYGATPVADVVEDLGIGEADLREEALRFAPPVLGRLRDEGFLELLIRRRLTPFFTSPEFRTALPPT